MPLPKRTTCKVPGCQEPLHQFPGGHVAVFCRAHLHLRNPRRLKGLPELPGGVRQLLAYLIACKAAGWEWVPLEYPDVDPRTIRAAFDRDWIFRSEGVDGTRYKITSRGEEHYQLYTPRRRRADHLCPRCGIEPRYRRTSGKLHEYCRTCTRERRRASYQASIEQGEQNGQPSTDF